MLAEPEEAAAVPAAACGAAETRPGEVSATAATSPARKKDDRPVERGDEVICIRVLYHSRDRLVGKRP